ncbi:MAG: Rieske 2Fe-2S domain-containing protein [Myxococcales bacterium]|nr:Rieske 2Fe-2S domain-containing protein [Myxococcales bacterium]
MDHAEQIVQLERLLDMIENRKTSMAESVYRNPVDDYTDPEQFEAEWKRLFRRLPLVVALSCELVEPGAYLTEDRVGLPALVIRGDDGKLRAFANVCRHRGTKLLRGCGVTKRRISCPYHAWSYTRDGALAHVPRDGAFSADINLGELGLTPLPVVERHGLVWLVPSVGAACDVDAFLGSAAADLASFAIEGYHHYETRSLRQAMNWKLVVDTFLETYHLGSLHRTTVFPILHGDVGAFDPMGPHLRNVYARRGLENLRDRPRSEWDFIEQTAIVYVLFPNTVFVMQGDHIETWRVFPDPNDVNASEIVLSLYTPEPTKTESAKRHWDRNMDLLVRTVLEEDFPVGEEIQRGFYSGAQDHVVYGRNEPALAHFHAAVRQALV